MFGTVTWVQFKEENLEKLRGFIIILASGAPLQLRLLVASANNQNSIFVLDSSIYCDPYFYPKINAVEWIEWENEKCKYYI